MGPYSSTAPLGEDLGRRPQGPVLKTPQTLTGSKWLQSLNPSQNLLECNDLVTMNGQEAIALGSQWILCVGNSSCPLHTPLVRKKVPSQLGISKIKKGLKRGSCKCSERQRHDVISFSRLLQFVGVHTYPGGLLKAEGLFTYFTYLSFNF